jgi:hypothetical protein
MNIKHWRAVLLAPVTVAFLAACQMPPPKDGDGSGEGSQETLINIKIDLAAARDASEITVTSPDQGCSTDGKGKKGCVQFAKNEVGTIEFRLNPEFPGRTCLTNPPSDWVITKVELSANGDADTEKGNFDGRPPPGWMVSAFPGISRKDGTLYFQPDTSKASQSVIIVDLNNHRDGSVKTAYYQVTASSCTANPKTILIDPAIRNKGK